MTSKEVERLTRVETTQADMAQIIEKMDKKLDQLQQSFDQLTGIQKALMWVTGVILAVGTLIISVINTLKSNH